MKTTETSSKTLILSKIGKSFGIFAALVVLSLTAISAHAQEPQSTPFSETPEQHAERMAWWREARFGMFIHWGPVSLTGKEISWSRANSNPLCPNHGPIPVAVYDNLYKKFDPEKFNADEWVNIAKDAGMKYMVLTAKHCDGFLLWKSKVDGYNIGATPFKRDVCAELAEAAHKQGMHIGWYFSPMDWRDPDCRTKEHNDRFVKKMQAELNELLSNYGKIDVLWFDSDGRAAMWDPVNTYALVRKLQPQILINNRLEMGSVAQWRNQGILLPNEDFYTPEQRVGGYDDKVPWETCMTLCVQWSWKPNDKMKSAAQVIHILSQCAGGDGNLLLDVGPMPNGQIEPRQVVVLKQVGDWLSKYGESIYGTRGGPWKPGKWGASTRNGNAIYLHLTQGGKIVLPPIAPTIVKSEVLTGGDVIVQQTDKNISLTVNAKPVANGEVLVKLELDKSAMKIPAEDVKLAKTR